MLWFSVVLALEVVGVVDESDHTLVFVTEGERAGVYYFDDQGLAPEFIETTTRAHCSRLPTWALTACDQPKLSKKSSRVHLKQKGETVMFKFGPLKGPLLMGAEQPVTRPMLIGHRGEPGVLPDHTLDSYSMAVRSGADFIEPDLVPTRDGVLIVRHENNLHHTTNVEEVFPERRTTRTVDGEQITGFFSEDFTLAEIKSLRARQPLDFRPQGYNDTFEIVTFDEVLAHAQRLAERYGRPVGVYPELKHVKHFLDQGIDVFALFERGLSRINPELTPVVFQCFEIEPLRFAAARRWPVKRILLIGELNKTPIDSPISYRDWLADPALATIVDGVGMWKVALRDQAEPKAFVASLHDKGLAVHLYTFRREQRYISVPGSFENELEYYLSLGIDGLFSDNSRETKIALHKWVLKSKAKP